MMDESPSHQGFLRHFHNCNHYDRDKFFPFFIVGQNLGWILKELKPFLCAQNDFFCARDDGLELNPRYDNFTARSDILGRITHLLAQKYNTPLRNEMYPIIQKWGDQPLAQVDRSSVPWFGIKGYGIHVNGFVRKADGLSMWIGERASDRLIDPGKLDNMIGGGQPIGLSLEENLCKEAQEEAGFSSTLALKAQHIRTIHYNVEKNNGLRNDVLFVYDLELDPTTIPHNTDGEVAAFHLMPLSKVATLIKTTNRFKFNCTLVIIDFLIRHGEIAPSDPEYNDLQKELLKSANV